MSELVVFICNVNRFRSVIAEHFLCMMLGEIDQKLAQEVEVASAAVATEEVLQGMKKRGLTLPQPLFGLPPHKNVIRLMARNGIDVSDQRSKELNTAIAKNATLIVAMEEIQKDRILSLYPWTRGRVLTLKEVAGRESLPAIELEEPLGIPIEDPEDPFSFSPDDKYVEDVATEIHRCLAKGMPVFLSFFLNK